MVATVRAVLLGRWALIMVSSWDVDVAVSALTLLVGRQEGRSACKKLSGVCACWNVCTLVAVWTLQFVVFVCRDSLGRGEWISSVGKVRVTKTTVRCHWFIQAVEFICLFVYGLCLHSMWSRVYVMVERPPVRLSVPSVGSSNGGQRVCCWARCGQETAVGAMQQQAPAVGSSVAAAWCSAANAGSVMLRAGGGGSYTSLAVSCFSKIQIGFTFLVSAHLGSPGQRAVKRARVCVCVCVLTGKILEELWSQCRWPAVAVSWRSVVSNGWS